MIKAGDVHEAYLYACERYVKAIMGRYVGINQTAWNELEPVMKQLFADMAAQLNKQFDCLAREEENDEASIRATTTEE